MPKLIAHHRNQEFAIKILEHLNADTDGSDMIHEILHMIKAFSGIEAVAIRLKEGEDYPYFSANGFPESFLQAEKYLCPNEGRDENGNPVLDCMCGTVICGRADPSYPFFSDGGSFWSNGTSELLRDADVEGRQSNTRNTCNRSGYESVALIPLKSRGKTIGLLQLNDRRAGCFTIEFIQFMERIGNGIGIALERSRSEDILNDEVRMEGIFEMAGTVCHQLNQPLMAISGCSDLLLMNSDRDDPLSPQLRTIGKQVRKMAGITRKLMYIIRDETAGYVGGSIIDIHRSARTG